jgi:histone deacetylase 1/2
VGYILTLLKYYAPDYELDVKASDMQNQNSVEYLEKIKIKIFENLKETTFVPSVELQDIPRISLGMDDEDDAMLDDADEDENPDVRMSRRRLDEATEALGELSESEDEDSEFLGPKGTVRRNEKNHKENGPGLSDIDETLSRASERSSSPKSIASQSEMDVEMKDVGEVAEELENDDGKANDMSDQEEVAPASKPSSPASTHQAKSPIKTEDPSPPSPSPAIDTTNNTDMEATEHHLAQMKVEPDGA